ncbi:hypothetical protein HLH89_21370 [Rhizobium laguerreae]|uniref:nSTAND3 domain-containing NTPase n=1 Tax=Rhizobium laguerreae TaxID=1076926 RepID=UPI00147855FA|nr:hypothetical protein [Rhizobium laguerreae]NNH83561.1 hypothetical protein [Rhizobium laguerreae]
MSAHTPAPGAAAALAGFEYQLNVSILAALRMLLIDKSCARLTLEPVDEEDIGADIDDHEAGPVMPSAMLAEGYRLVIQVKHYSGEPWSLEDFEALLKHGKKRKPAREHLDDLGVHYLLITSAAVKGKAADLEVSNFEETSDPTKFPPSLRSTLTSLPEGRVAIWPGLTEHLLEFEIAYVLRDLLRIPQGRIGDCRMALEKEARLRMRGVTPGVWTRNDLAATVRSFGGYLASAAELTAFVPPSNFDDMLSVLNKKHAIVIRGPSGTGKTLAAIALCERARLADGRIDVVVVGPNDDPATTRRLIDTGPKLFYLEDPWGDYSLRNGHRTWTDQLPRLLASARPEHQYIVTSRSDMLQQARAGESLQRWSVELDAESYRSGELGVIYDRRMDLLATNLQSLALTFRKDALESLETPLEIDLFFTNLADGPDGDAPQNFFKRLMSLAHRDAVEEVVVAYLGELDVLGTSAVIWALLKARNQLDRAHLAIVQRELRALHPELSSGLQKLVDRLEATRHLRQPVRLISFAHPSVRAGFETFLKLDWDRTERAVVFLVRALVRLKGRDEDWGMQTAAQVLNVARELKQAFAPADERLEVDEETHTSIDRWLEESLMDNTSDFKLVLQLAADVGTERSNLCELARWFSKGFPPNRLWDRNWCAPVYGDEWYARVSADARTACVIDRFIREHLSQDHHASYGPDLADRLDRLTSAAAPAFLDVAFQLVRTDYSDVVRTIARGAVRDLVAFEPLLLKALDVIADLHELQSKERGRSNAIDDGVYDLAAEDFYSHRHEDEGYAAGVFIEAYISAKRAEGNWRDVRDHPRSNEMMWYWATDVCASSSEPELTELVALVEAATTEAYEGHAWDAVCRHWNPGMVPILISRVGSSPDNPALRQALAQCLVQKAPNELSECLSTARASSQTKLVQLVLDLWQVCHTFIETENFVRTSDVSAELNPIEREIFDALPQSEERPGRVGSEALAMLVSVAMTASVAVLERIVPIIAVSGGDVAEPTGRWLSESEDARPAKRAATMAAEIGSETLLWKALVHERADARAVALEYLLAVLPNPLPSQILALATDPGYRVRRTLVKALADRPHADHLPTVVRMTGDRWSDVEPHFERNDSFPIARSAVTALLYYANLPSSIAEHLLSLGASTTDRDLSKACLLVAAVRFSDEVRKRIWEIAFDEKRGAIRIDAADALAAAPDLDPALVTSISPEYVLALHWALTASITRLACAHLPVKEAAAFLEQMAYTTTHRSLVLVGAVTIHERDGEAAKRIMSILGREHPTQPILHLAKGTRLPFSALDDLGDVRIRRAVQRDLADRIKK